MSAELAQQPDPSAVLGKAVLRAAEHLGISRPELAAVVGRDRTSISRNGIDPASKSGELGALLVRCYRSLSVMVDGDPEQIRHWMHTHNLHLNGAPAQLIKNVAGLVSVCNYLDAIRGPT